MGYAIVGGAGLIVGLGLMIWALRERTLRHFAERKADEEAAHRARFEAQAVENAEVAQELDSMSKRLMVESETIRSRLEETRIRLAQCGDPKAVKDWLDSELEKEVL